MRLVSQNVLKYFAGDDVTARLNMAWSYSYDSLQARIDECPGDVFLDVPVRRSKPGCPENKHDENASWIAYCNSDFFFPEFSKFVEKNRHKVQYVAVSNIDEPSDLLRYMDRLGGFVKMVPKIESVKAIENLPEILKLLTNSMYVHERLRDEAFIMLDHDDLHVDIVKRGLDAKELYSTYVHNAELACRAAGVKMLRTEGVIFSDDPIT